MARRLAVHRRICSSRTGRHGRRAAAAAAGVRAGLDPLFGGADPPEIEAARRLLLAQRSLSLLVALVLEAAGWQEEAEALRRSGSSFACLRGSLCEAAEYAATNPLVAAVIDCAQKLVASADDVQPARQAQLPFRTAQLAVSVIQCNDAPARRLLLGDRPRMRLLEFLEEAVITIIEEAIGPVRRPPPFTDPWEVLEAGERFKAAMAEGFPPACPGQLEPPLPR
jgi:hypothetical protein